jgi:hypothetical protein
MSTDWLPHPPIEYDRMKSVILDAGVELSSADHYRVPAVKFRIDGFYIHALRTEAGFTEFSQYGSNQVNAPISWIQKIFKVQLRSYIGEAIVNGETVYDDHTFPTYQELYDKAWAVTS